MNARRIRIRSMREGTKWPARGRNIIVINFVRTSCLIIIIVDIAEIKLLLLFGCCQADK